ncbi:hypothetical protein AWQ21_01375 [Picosynechococcus sp. PCC 7003]|uniref:WD40 repeat domain-containing protein n=1 Tax=Picosynechococcus sp. PCC 7003 TaxID=374981 RepID=UPI000810BE29|nr:WD40 repeat domain-containing protein [Picosynechococcus sp. PCC 7003]ANV83155.1 hypothetical protein AWQ21_01375 [Picosynechococcus sp. PCC 7003]
MGKKQQWLEIAELGLLLLVFLAWLWNVIQGDGNLTISLVTFLLWVTLGLNFFNRIAHQRQQRRQILGTVRSLEQRLQGQFQGQLQPLTEQIRQASQINASLAQIETDGEMQTYLRSLEKALTNVVQYLNEAVLDERLTNLEQEFLRQQPNPIGKVPSTAQIATDDLEPEAIADPWTTETLPASEPPAAPQPKQQWQLVATLTAHRDCVSALAFSADQKFLASGSWDHQLKLWRVEDQKQISQVTAHEQGLLNLAFIPPVPGTKTETDPIEIVAIASSSFSPEVKLWHLDQSQAVPQLALQNSLEGHQGAVYAMALTGQQTLITGSHDQTLRQWQLRDGSVYQKTLDLNDQIQAIALAPQGNLFISGGTEGVLKFWRTTDHRLLGSLKNDPPAAIAAIAIRTDGKLFASAGEHGLIHLWQVDLNHLEVLPETVPCFTLEAHEKPVTQLLFSRQGHFLLSSSVDGTIKIWQLGIPEPLTTLNFNTPDQEDHVRLLSLALTADGRTLAAGGSDGTIKIWQQI